MEELDETVEQLIQEAEASLTTRREAEPLPNRLASIESLPLVVQFKELLPLGKTLNIDVDEQTSVLQEIVEHCEKLERYEKLGKNAEINGLPTMGADGGLQAKALLVLGNLTTQLLHIFATYTYLDLVTVVAEPDSDAGKVRHLRNLWHGPISKSSRYFVPTTVCSNAPKKSMRPKTPSLACQKPTASHLLQLSKRETPILQRS